MSQVQPGPRPQSGIGIAAAAWAGAIAASIVCFQIVVAVTGHSGEDLDSLPFVIFPISSMLSLWVPTLLILWVLSTRRLTGSVVADYGLRFRWIDLIGIPIGVASQLLVLRVVYWPLSRWFPDTFSSDDVERAARDLTERATGGWRVALVLAVVVGAPLVEELLYRGLILPSLSRAMSAPLAVLLGALWFAAAHLQAVQFLGLAVFGLVLGACWTRTGRLGMGILAHAAFNATSVVMLWPRD